MSFAGWFPWRVVLRSTASLRFTSPLALVTLLSPGWLWLITSRILRLASAALQPPRDRGR